MKNILLKGGYLVDPGSNLNQKGDILIENGIIKQIAQDIKPLENYEVLDIDDQIVIPSLFDMHAHLRTPGREDEENLVSGAMAALKGGFTRLCCMPNTYPAIDHSGVVSFIIEKSKQDNLIDIYPIAAITKQSKGKELTEMFDLKQHGAIAFSDDGTSISNAGLMRKALEYAKMLDMTIISHCEDNNLSAAGCINEGIVSTKLGLRGMPRESETSIVARDIMLSKLTQSKLHIAHLSCKESVNLVRKAKNEGIKVTSETCPHYFYFSEDDIIDYNTNMKVNPPLRTKEDIEALIEGISDNTIDVISTDHAPHAVEEKDLEFDKAPFGMIGLETAVSVIISRLIKESNIINWSKLVELMSINPALILNKECFTIKEGKMANLTVIKKSDWTVSENFYSLSKNSPFIGKTLHGIVNYVFSKGVLLVKSSEVQNF